MQLLKEKKKKPCISGSDLSINLTRLVFLISVTIPAHLSYFHVNNKNVLMGF